MLERGTKEGLDGMDQGDGLEGRDFGLSLFPG